MSTAASGGRLDGLDVLARALHERVPRVELARHIRAEIRGDPDQLLARQRLPQELVRNPERGGRVRAPSAEPRRDRHALPDRDGERR